MDGSCLLVTVVLVVVQALVGESSGPGSERELSAVLNNGERERSSSGSSSSDNGAAAKSEGSIFFSLESINNADSAFASFGLDAKPPSRWKRGFFDKDQERQRKEEEYDKSFRLFWLLGGIAIVLFICIFILTLLCLCCPNCHNKGTPAVRQPVRSPPPPQLPECPFQSAPPSEAVEMTNRIRSASVISATNMNSLCPQYRLSQEQVNAIQNRRSSNLLLAQAQGGTSALVDVNVVHENHSEA